MLKKRFKRSHADPCLYYKKDEDGILIILVLYIDDMLLPGKKKSTLNALKQHQISAFSMKDLGEAEHILGMRIKRDRQQYTLHLSQEKYIEKVLDRFNVADAKSLGVPLQPHVRLSEDDCPKDDDAANYMKNVAYASACGSLMVATPPDIAHVVEVGSRLIADPGRAHWDAIKSILRCFKGTKGKCLCYEKVPLKLKGFCHSDMAGDVDTHKSTSGHA